MYQAPGRDKELRADHQSRWSPTMTTTKLLASLAVAITACAVWPGCLNSLGQANPQTNPQDNAMITARATERSRTAAAASEAIRPFRVNIPQEQLDDLRRRIAATRFPEKETVADQSHGIRRLRRGRFRRRDPGHAGIRLLRQADREWLGARPRRACVGRSDEAARLHEVRGAGRRLGCRGRRSDGRAGASRAARHP